MRSILTKGMLMACLFYPAITTAQNEIDALRYSQVMFGSTARSLSMGGAFGALGADFSTLSTNPAGIGIYRKSEFTVSMGFNNRKTESEFINTTESDSKFNVDLPNLGLVFAFPRKNSKNDWRQFGFALGYNRTANFNSESYYNAKNNDNSILDSFVDEIALTGGASEDDLFQYYPFDIDLAYQTYLINPLASDSNQYSTVIPNAGAYQSGKKTTSGGMGEFSIGFGGSYKDKVYFGVTIGFPTLRYEEDLTLEEVDVDNEIISGDSISGYFDFKSMRYDQHLKTTGNGFNGKFGIIVKPVDWLRVGAAIHTPTYFYMSDNYSSSMYSSFGGGFSYSAYSPEGVFSYNLSTPFRAIGSLAFIIAKQGLISFDYEITDYGAAKLDANGIDDSGTPISFNTENRTINTIYTGFAANYRGGIEWTYEKLSFRAGAAYYSSPFKTEYTTSNTNQHVISYTGGIGYREKRFFADIGYGYAKRNEYVGQYTLSYETVPGVVQSRVEHKVITTVGFKF
jgi:hypothetical protein